VDEIHYAGDTLLTGSDIAEALLAYAQALASKEASSIRNWSSRSAKPP
jgi:hypothetical protein